MSRPFDPTRTSIAEQILTVGWPLLLDSRPDGIPAAERDRVLDLDPMTGGIVAPTNLPAILLQAYEEKLPPLQEAGVERHPADGLEKRSVHFHFLLFGQAAEGKTATQSTDLLASWIVNRWCGEIDSASPFFHLADRAHPAARTSTLAKGARAYCATAFEIVFATNYLTTDLTRRR